MTVCPVSATAPVPTLMSQYCRPSAVWVGSPLTLVGPLAPGCAGGVAFLVGFGGVVPLCARATDANESRAMIFSIRTPSQALQPYTKAITSISTSTSLGNRAASTVDLAGGAALKYWP